MHLARGKREKKKKKKQRNEKESVSVRFPRLIKFPDGKEAHLPLCIVLRNAEFSWPVVST